MRTLKIQILRNGDDDNHPLDPDTEYLGLLEDYKEEKLRLPCKQREFFGWADMLRYNQSSDNFKRSAAINKFKNLVTDFLSPLQQLEKLLEENASPVNIKISSSAFEIVQLPFELLTDLLNKDVPDNYLLLRDKSSVVSLTREVKGSKYLKYEWPAKPRILFVWAQPNNTVPHAKHWSELIEITKPFAKPFAEIPFPVHNLAPHIKEIRNVSLEEIAAALTEARTEGAPFTHVHILAHGYAKEHFGVLEFNLALCSNENKENARYVTAKELCNALIPSASNPEQNPVVVSIIACDGGNMGSPLSAGGSIAYQLHSAGIPCVFASQFPLTESGSVDLIKFLYGHLTKGKDPRIALFEVRKQLFLNNTHDWASIVAYLQLHPTMEAQLENARLQLLFQQMIITRCWSDHIIQNIDKIELPEKKAAALDLIVTRLQHAIISLEEKLDHNGNSTLLSKKNRVEHYGLLGSACKRLAEHLFWSAKITGNPSADAQLNSKELINKSSGYYSKGYTEGDFSDHWTGMQYLSTKIIAEELSNADKEIFISIKSITECNVKKHPQDLWAKGTLAELYLLMPFLYKDEEREKLIAQLLPLAENHIQSIQASGNKEIIESTARQLDRYINWWVNVFEPGIAEGIVNHAHKLRDILQP